MEPRIFPVQVFEGFGDLFNQKLRTEVKVMIEPTHRRFRHSDGGYDNPWIETGHRKWLETHKVKWAEALRVGLAGATVDVVVADGGSHFCFNKDQQQGLLLRAPLVANISLPGGLNWRRIMDKEMRSGIGAFLGNTLSARILAKYPPLFKVNPPLFLANQPDTFYIGIPSHYTESGRRFWVKYPVKVAFFHSQEFDFGVQMLTRLHGAEMLDKSLSGGRYTEFAVLRVKWLEDATQETRQKFCEDMTRFFRYELYVTFATAPNL